MTPTGAIQFEERKMISKGQKIEPAQGKLGVMLPGMGAVTSTFIAGVEAIKKGLCEAHWIAYSNGDYPFGQTHGQSHP